MKKLLQRIASAALLMLFPFITSAQQSTVMPCGMDELVRLAKEKNPNYDKLMAEQEKLRDQWKVNYLRSSQGIPTIPVVVHVMWNGTQPYVSDSQVVSQINALNIDYMRLNPDTGKAPSAFKALAASPNIQFCLAQRDPLGNAINGIDRHMTSKSVFNLVYGDTSIWYSSLGGSDEWDPSQYFNIWVCDISPAGGFGIWPGGVFQGSKPGVVVNYKFFGTMGTAVAPYNLGRTVTHETGHYLDLHHLWGDVQSNSGCTQTDFCNDTPPQVTASQNCPGFPKTDVCSNVSPGLAFMDFMDYPVDSCKNLFTADQCIRMNACLNGARASLLTSPACIPVSGINEILQANDVTIFPNPSNGKFSVSCSKVSINAIEIYNSMGQVIRKQVLNKKQEIINMDVASGIYSVKVYSGKTSATKKLVIEVQSK